MTKSSVAYTFAALLLFQPVLLLAADKDAGSFFHRTRKTQAVPAPVTVEEPKKEMVTQLKTTGEALTEEEKAGLPPPPKLDQAVATGVPKVPPVATSPNRGYITPKPPPAAPNTPKEIPKAPAVPKAK